MKAKNYIDEIDILLILDTLQKQQTPYQLARKYYNYLKKENDFKAFEAYIRYKLKRLEKLKILKVLKKENKNFYKANSDKVYLGSVTLYFKGDKELSIEFPNALVVNDGKLYYLCAFQK